MSPDQTVRFRSRVGEAALVAGALWYLGAYLIVALARINYPYDLEWMEGGTVDHVARVLRGLPLYVPPSLEFTPYIYAPIYYYVAAPFAYLFGLRLVSLRIVSFAASLGVLALIAALVHGRTRSRLGALVGAGLFAALYDRSGAFFDLARVDSLALLFMLLGVWLLCASERHDVVAGLLIAAACFTKQSMLLMAGPVVLARAWSRRGPRRLQCLAAFGAVAAGGGLLLALRTHGWSTYYLFTLPASHPWVPGAWFRYWRDDLFTAVPVAMLALALVIARARGVRAARPVELAAVLGSLLEAWSSRVHTGAFSNVLMPVYACLAWQFGTVLGDLDQASHAPPAREEPDFARPGLVAALAPWACLLQLALLWYRPWRLVPTAADRAAGAALVTRIAAVPGPVLVPYHPHLARLAGKATSAQEMAFFDVLRGRDRSVADALTADVNQRLRQREFAAVVVDQDWWPAELNLSYRPSETLWVDAPTVFWPRTGWPTRPRTIYDRRP